MNRTRRNARLSVGPVCGRKPLLDSTPSEGSHTALGMGYLLSCTYHNGFDLCLHAGMSPTFIPFAGKMYGTGARGGSTHYSPSSSDAEERGNHETARCCLGNKSMWGMRLLIPWPGQTTLVLPL